jgi:hypothetical protein
MKNNPERARQKVMKCIRTKKGRGSEEKAKKVRK